MIIKVIDKLLRKLNIQVLTPDEASLELDNYRVRHKKITHKKADELLVDQVLNCGLKEVKR